MIMIMIYPWCRSKEGAACTVVEQPAFHFSQGAHFCCSRLRCRSSVLVRRPVTCAALFSHLESVGVVIPDVDGPVFTTTNDNGEIGMEGSKGGVIGMTLHTLYAAFGEVIPDLDRLVVSGSDEIRTIGTRMKVNVIDTLIMCMDCKVGMWRAERPHFDSAIEKGRRECICVFWVECNIHDVVRVFIEYLHR